MNNKRYADDIKNLDDFMESLDFQRPVKNTREVFNKKKKIYKNVLKSVGSYSIFTSLFVSIYFGLKKIAVSAYFTKFFIATLFISSGSIGAYFIYTNLNQPEIVEHKATVSLPVKEITKEVKPAIKKEIINEVKPVTKEVNYKILLKPVSTGSADIEIVRMVSSGLLKSFRKIKGNDFAAYAKSESPYVMRTSVEKLENSYVILVKVIDSKSSSILYVTKENVEKKSGISTACDRLVSGIINKLK